MYVGVRRKSSGSHFFYGDAELIFVRTAAYRVGPPDFLAVNVEFNGQVLAWLENKFLPVFFRNVKAYGYTFFCFPVYFNYFKSPEMSCQY